VPSPQRVARDGAPGQWQDLALEWSRAAPAIWPHTNPIVSTPVGLAVLVVAIGSIKLSRRLGQTALIVSADRVKIQRPWRTRELTWGQSRSRQ